MPHFSNPYFSSDRTHRKAFGLYSLDYFVGESLLKRKVPRYGPLMPFVFKEISLGFKSTPPFYGRHAFKSLVHRFINMTNGLKAFYEETPCYLAPCYEVHFLLVRM